MKKAHITCPYCHAPAQLRPASSIYGIHTKDRAAKLYVCSRYRVYLPVSTVVSEVKKAYLPQPCALAVEEIDTTISDLGEVTTENAPISTQ